jgi:hypothetical protein
VRREGILAKDEHHPTDPPTPLPRISFLLFLSFMLTALGLLLYGQSLLCPFLWDEYGIIMDNAGKGAFEWRNLPSLFGQRYFHIPGSPELRIHLHYYRPVTVFFHALSYHVFGLAPWGYRLESLLLHVGNAVLLFVLLSAFFSEYTDLYNRSAVVLTGTLLFFTHPRNVESVCIIANQTGLLCAFFALLSLLCWTRILVGSRCLPSLYFASLFTLLLAMLAKESGYVVPLLHGLFFLVLDPKRSKKRCWLLSGYFLLVLVPLSVRHLFLEGTSIGAAFVKELSRQGSLLSYLKPVLLLFFHQLDQWFFPVDIQLFQYPFLPEGITFREVVLPVLVSGGLVWRLREDRRLLAFGFGLFFIAYMPSSNLIPMGKLPGGGLKTGAHHLYLAQAGLALLAGAALFSSGRRVPEAAKRSWKRLLSWFLALALVLLLCHQTFRFSGYFRGADRFYQAVLERNPAYSGAWQNYGWYKLYLEGKPDEAERILLDGLEVVVSREDFPGERKLTWNLLHLYLAEGRFDEAQTLLQCRSEKWIEDPVGNHYFWTLVQGLERKDEDASL